MNKEKNYISSSYFGRAFYSEKNILCVLLSTKSPTTIGFLSPMEAHFCCAHGASFNQSYSCSPAKNIIQRCSN